MVEEQVPEPPAEAAATAAPAVVAPAAAAPAPAEGPELSPAECAARLAALFPALFGPPPFKPIKLRIQADIQERAPGQFTKKSLSLFLHRHTTSTAYLKGLVANASRFDLDGQAAGEVAAEHKAAAETELARRREIVEAKKAAFREQHREQRRDQNREQQREQKREHFREQARQQRQQAREVQDAEWAARRERAALLRAFETTTLTRANFCALKRIADAELDALLERARAERAEWAQRPPQPARDERRGPPPPQHDRPPRQDRGPRPPRGPEGAPGQDRPPGPRAPGGPARKPRPDKAA